MESIMNATGVADDAASSNLKIFRGGGAIGEYASSPFVTKVEMRLRLAGQTYSVDDGAPWLGPKGKIPYVEIPSEVLATQELDAPTKLGDSALIIKHMIDTSNLKDLNADLSPAEKTQDLALRALLEDKLYFMHMRECWIDNYYEQRDQALASVPTPVRFFVGQLVYRKVCRTLYGQGVGRYSSDEVDMFRIEIWSSVNDLLADIPVKPETAEPFWCLGGSEPTEADITIFGFVSSILTGLSCPGSRNLLRSLPAIMDYADRIHNKYFPDYQQWQINETTPVLAKL